MRRVVWWSLLSAFLPIWVACTSAPPVSERVLTEEEQRLAKAARIDSTTLLRVVDPKTVEGYEMLDSVSAEAWILVEASQGLVISQKNAHQRMFPASLTKMMTCLLTLENAKMTDSIEVLKADYVTRDARVRPGDGYEVGNLTYEMMLMSDNVAAYTLGRHVAGDTLTFLRMMNEKARYLGMDGTNFANLNGMPNDSNYTTARDLLVLSRYCMGDSSFARIVGTPSMDIPLTDHRHLPCQNTNLLLTDYEGCIGIKTGYTRLAGHCLAAAATRDGVTLFLVLLKSKSRAARFAESAQLLDFGFRVLLKGFSRP